MKLSKAVEINTKDAYTAALSEIERLKLIVIKLEKFQQDVLLVGINKQGENVSECKMCTANGEGDYTPSCWLDEKRNK